MPTVAPIIQAALTVSPRCSASTPRQAAAKAARPHQNSFLANVGMRRDRRWDGPLAYDGRGVGGRGVSRDAPTRATSLRMHPERALRELRVEPPALRRRAVAEIARARLALHRRDHRTRGVAAGAQLFGLGH